MKQTELEQENESQESTGAPEHTANAAAAGISAAELAELKTKAARADENWERLLRSAADFDNFKKRAAREKADAIKFANESLLQKLIPVLDNFDAALNSAQGGKAAEGESFQQGVSMIYRQLLAALAEAGLEEVDATDKPFDPTMHEAVAQKETTEAPEGRVVQQLRKGFKLKDRLLRPAGVIVAKPPAA
jgi:molecular chaperone GrpE